MTTAAAIDRLVHHSVIVELNIPSYHAEQAKKSKQGRAVVAEEAAGMSVEAAKPPAVRESPRGSGDLPKPGS